MKVVFLDIDGVLNNDESKYLPARLDSACVSRVSRICELTDAKVVITST